MNANGHFDPAVKRQIDEEFNELIKSNPKIVLLSAKPGGGKTTLAKNLTKLIDEQTRNFKVVPISFARILYPMEAMVWEHLSTYGFVRTTTRDATILQDFGNWVRSIDEDGLVYQAKRDILKHWDGVQTNGRIPVFLIDSNRFRNEFDSFPTALHIRLVAPYEVRQQRTYSRRDETNITETDLDGYAEMGKFDMYLDTDQYSPEYNAELVFKKLQLINASNCLIIDGNSLSGEVTLDNSGHVGQGQTC